MGDIIDVAAFRKLLLSREQTLVEEETGGDGSADCSPTPGVGRFGISG